MRNLLINMVFVVTSIALTLIAADVALRLFSAVAPRSGQFIPEPGNYQRLNLRTATLSPNYQGLLNGRDFSSIPIHTNQLGFRDDEFDYDALTGSQPVLFLGDSYLWGWGVQREARASDVFSRELRAHAIDTPVLNMTIPGSGTYQALDLFREFGLPLNPRLVVLGFFVGNDFLDNQAAAKIDHRAPAPGSTGGASLTLIDASQHAGALSLRELIRTSPVFNLIKYGMWESSAFRSLFNRLEIQNDRIALYATQSDGTQDSLYGPTLDALTEIANLAQSADVPLLVLIIPDHLQVLEPQLFADYNNRKPQQILSRHLSALGVPYHDLLPAFTTAPDPQQLFFREDKHWSRDGNQLVAKELTNAVQGILTGGSQPIPAQTAMPE